MKNINPVVIFIVAAVLVTAFFITRQFGWFGYYTEVHDTMYMEDLGYGLAGVYVWKDGDVVYSNTYKFNITNKDSINKIAEGAAEEFIKKMKHSK